jgi:hypothetical protein
MQSILGNSRKSDIIFYRSGQIDITVRIAKSLNLQSGDVIDIMCDRNEYYLYVKHRAPLIGRHEGTAFPSKAKGNHFRAWSKSLCSAILQECKIAGKVRLRVGEPIELGIYGTALPIITQYIL